MHNHDKIKPHTHQKLLEAQKQKQKEACAHQDLQERSNDSQTRVSQTCLWVLEDLLGRHGSAMACLGGTGTDRRSPKRHSVWHKCSWKRYPLDLPESCWVGDPQTGQQLYQRSSHMVVKVLGLTRLPKLDAAKRVGISMGSELEGQKNSITEIPQDREKQRLGQTEILGRLKENLARTRTLYAGQELTGRIRHGTINWFKIGKGVYQDCILSPAYLTYMIT